MQEDIVFKGLNGELQLFVNEAADFEEIFAQLQSKLLAANDFFSGRTVVLVSPSWQLSGDEKGRLADLLAGYGLTCREAKAAKRRDELAAAAAACSEQEGYAIKALVVNRTLRSGQKVAHDESVVVIGDVNPGAQVVAGGDIIILGACRGVAHAGAFGNQAATITANRILATQLRIAGLIARAPDELDKSAYVETARIKDGMVVIEPANR
jgi:septum site-determining protein MinC